MYTALVKPVAGLTKRKKTTGHVKIHTYSYKPRNDCVSQTTASLHRFATRIRFDDTTLRSGQRKHANSLDNRIPIEFPAHRMTGSRKTSQAVVSNKFKILRENVKISTFIRHHACPTVHTAQAHPQAPYNFHIQLDHREINEFTVPVTLPQPCTPNLKLMVYASRDKHFNRVIAGQMG